MTAGAAAPTRRRLPVAVPVAVALAWAAAGAAHATGLGHGLHHDTLAGDSGHRSHHDLPDAVGGRGTRGFATLTGFAAFWVVMVVAMMLPSAVPLLRLFTHTAARQVHPGRALACFAGGYLAVWALFGWVALGLDVAVHHTVHTLSWLAARPWLVSAATLGLAGAFQFSELKDRCLTNCRHPAAYLLRHYRRGPGAALLLGWGHGLYCVGCCWALMLVMFAAGVSDLVWMAALGALMAYEKIGRHGTTIATAAGVAFLALSALVALHPAWMPPI